nr:LamG domain-containing protein [Tessaracoccus sp. MC1627]
MVVFTPIAGTWWAKVVDGIGSAGAVGAYDDAVAAIGSVQCYYPLDDAPEATTARNLGTSGVALTKGNTAAFGALGIGDGETSATTGASNGYFFTSADKPLSAAGLGTFAAIIKLDDLSLNRGLYQAGIKLSLPMSGLLTMLVDGVTTTASIALVAGRRYHVAAVVDGTAHRIYIDGEQVGVTTTATVIVANALNNQICLDGGNFCNKSTWAGVVVTPHALTPAQIASLATAAGL